LAFEWHLEVWRLRLRFLVQFGFRHSALV